MTFLEKHLIKQINEQLKYKESVLKHNHFYWFDEPVKSKKKVIDRVNRWNLYFKDEVLPGSWYSLDGSVLREIYFKLKFNDFYIYKKLEDGKSYKTRIKKSANKRI